MDEDLRRDWPAFDPRTAGTYRGFGPLNRFLADLPGARRSAHPDASMVAVGPLAGTLVEPHRLGQALGEGSPLERFVRLGGKTLLLGAPLDAVTRQRLIIMASRISNRIASFIDALPLAPGLRVLEIGCGPGVAAREISRRAGSGFVLAIDRSAKAIASAVAGSRVEIATGRLRFRQAAIENFELPPGEEPFDIAFAMRIGVLDGRHPDIERRALERLRVALKPTGRLFIDTGHPLREVGLDR